MPQLRSIPIFRFILAGGVVVLAAAAWLDPPRRSDEVSRYVIPPGTAARVLAGEPVDDALPERVTARVGRRLVVTNEDEVSHVFGPFVLAPGQTWTREFAAAGKVKMACSVYPETGFVVDVLPAEQRVGPTRWVWLALVAASIVATAVFSAQLSVVPARTDGVAMMRLSPVGPRPAANRSGSTIGAATASTPAFAGNDLPVAPGQAALAFLLLAIAAETTALSRDASWSAALIAGLTQTAPLAAALAVLAVAIVRRVAAGQLPDRPWLTYAGGALLVAAALLLTPLLGVRAWPAALSVAGFGLILEAIRRIIAPDRRTSAWQDSQAFAASRGAGPQRTDDQGTPTPPSSALAPPDNQPASPAAHEAGLIMWIGALLVVMGWLPARITPPAAGFLGTAYALTSVLLLASPRPAIPHCPSDWEAARGWLSLSAISGALVVLVALVVHVSATTLPLAGNPVRPDSVSVNHGADLWQARCAGCHATLPSVASQSDHNLLRIITFGHAGTPGLAYELEIESRGDIVNFLRRQGQAVTGAGSESPTGGR